MFPGVPSSLSGAYVIGEVDQECQARVVTHLGRPSGCWLDDTTPNLDHWLGLAVAKYRPLGQPVFVCVPPGRPHLHHKPCPPVVNVYEAYVYGMGCPVEDWLPLPRYTAYCVQKQWPGTHGKTAPTQAEFERLLKLVQANHPIHIFLF